MPTTAAGRSFTARSFTNSVGDPTTWGVADDLYGSMWRKPVLLFCHGAGSDETALTASSALAGLRDVLIDHGWVYVEALGLSVTHWGHEAACESYALSLREVADRHPLGPVVIMGRSMGGTVASSLATQDQYGIRPHVAGVSFNSAVQSMIQYMVVEGKYSTGIPWYGDPTVDEAAWMAATEPFDPIRFDPADFAALPVQWIAGTHDASVAVEPNSRAQYDRVKDHAAYTELIVRGFAGHGGTNGTYDMVDQMWSFLRRCVGQYPRPSTLHLDGVRLSGGAIYYPSGWRQVEPLTA